MQKAVRKKKTCTPDLKSKYLLNSISTFYADIACLVPVGQGLTQRLGAGKVLFFVLLIAQSGASAS
jgi:hypothetical protein